MISKHITTNPDIVVLNNFPWSDQYSESSFIGNLGGIRSWNKNRYWELEWALCKLNSGFDYNSNLRWPIFRIFSITLGALGSHLDPNDGFYFDNIKNEDTYALRERVQLVFEGFFAGSMPDFEACFDEVNPLLDPSSSMSIH